MNATIDNVIQYIDVQLWMAEFGMNGGECPVCGWWADPLELWQTADGLRGHRECLELRKPISR